MATPVWLPHLVLLATVVMTTYASVTFDHHIDTDEYSLHSVGKLKKLVELTAENGVKRLLCKGPVILVAMDNMTAVSGWEVGNIVVGGHEWGCSMRDGLGEDPHVEYGFHRIIEEIRVKTDRRVDLHTAPAAVFDFFEEASIQYHHRQLQGPPDHDGGRRKRSVIPWKASNADVPIPDDIVAAAKAERLDDSGDDDDWASYNGTQAFYEARQLLADIDWHKEFQQIIPINYDEATNKAQGYFGLEDGQFVHDSDYFAGKAARAAAEAAATDLPDSRYKLHCTNCYSYYRPEVKFELEIDNLEGIKKYFLQLSGDYVVNVDLEGQATGEVSTALKQLLFR